MPVPFKHLYYCTYISQVKFLNSCADNVYSIMYIEPTFILLSGLVLYQWPTLFIDMLSMMFLLLLNCSDPPGRLLARTKHWVFEPARFSSFYVATST